MEITGELRGLIASGAAAHVIKHAAMRNGMRSLLDDGVDKAARGLTTLDEVIRVATHGEPGEMVGAQMQRTGEPEPAGAAAAAPTSGGRVLVVEDSPTIATVVKYFLELEGLEVTVASDGIAGLEVAKREVPDVIVTDMHMPGMDGVDMVKALRATPGGLAPRILMLTSEASVDTEATALAAGADDYILKPVEPRRLAARVKALRLRGRSAAA